MDIEGKTGKSQNKEIIFTIYFWLNAKSKIKFVTMTKANLFSENRYILHFNYESNVIPFARIWKPRG